MTKTSPHNDCLVILYSAGLFAAAPIGIVSLMSMQIAHDFNLSAAGQGLAISIFSLVGAGFGYFVGAVLARHDGHRLLVAGLALMTVTSLLTAWSPSSAWFFGTRIAASVGFIVVVTALPVMLSHLPSRRAQIGLALWGAYLPLGIAVGAGFATIAAGLGLSWRAAFVAMSALGLLSVLLTARRSETGPASSLKSHGSQGTDQGRQGSLDVASMLYALGFAVYAAMFMGFASTLPRTLAGTTSLGPAEVGTATVVILTLGAASSLAALRLTSRLTSPLPIFMLALVGTAVGAIGMYRLEGSAGVVLASAVLLILASNIIPSLVFAYLPLVARHPDKRASLSGLLTQAGNLGALIGAPGISCWIAWAGWSMGWLPFALLCPLCLILFALPLQRTRIAKPRSIPELTSPRVAGAWASLRGLK